MNDIIIAVSLIVMLFSCYIQYKITNMDKHLCYILPMIYGMLTFVIGLFALLFSFLLIFIAEFTYTNRDVSNGNT